MRRSHIVEALVLQSHGGQLSQHSIGFLISQTNGYCRQINYMKQKTGARKSEKINKIRYVRMFGVSTKTVCLMQLNI